MFEISGSNIEISETVKASNMDNTRESELLENIPASIWTNIASYLDKPDQNYIMFEKKTSGSNIDDSEIVYYCNVPGDGTYVFLYRTGHFTGVLGDWF